MQGEIEMQAKRSLISILILAITGTAANAQTALKTILPPGGGKIVYGQVAGQTTEPGGMCAVLRSIHHDWGDEPQVGKFFRVRGTSSLAAFLTGVNHAKGDAQLAGMVIVSQVSPERIEAAVLTDDVKRFGGTINAMLGELLKEWHPAAVSADAATAGTSIAVPQLHKFVLPDRSACASLPEGWQITPASGGGTIIAQGPQGEKALLGFTMRPLNTNDPKVRRTMQFAQGAGRNTAYGQALYYPYGGDPAKSYVDLVQMFRAKKGLPPADFQIESETALPCPPGWHRVNLTGHVDGKDGVGMTEMNVVFSIAPPGPTGGYMTYTNATSVPVQLADQERAAMIAVLSSYSFDQQVVQNQASAIAAPEIARIHEIGRRAAQQAAASHAAADAHNAAVERHWDSIDKSSTAFGNYVLDQTVIQDNKGNTHGTVWNQTADALVRSDPQRYEYVATPNLRRGVDF
jgi:hypothetical protein